MGGRFWIGLVAVIVAIGIGTMIVFLILGAALATWGILGMFLLIAAIALGAGWVYDRRRPPPLDRI